MQGVSIYIAEIADKDIRGKLGTAYNLMKLFGAVIVYCAGPYVSYEVLGIICAVFPVLFFVTFVFMPESPYYLIKVGKKAEAKKCLARLQSKCATESEIDKMILDIENTVELDLQNKTSMVAIFNKEFRKPFLIMIGKKQKNNYKPWYKIIWQKVESYIDNIFFIGVKTLQQFGGANAIDSYMQTIIKESGTDISEGVSSIVYGLIEIPAGMQTQPDLWNILINLLNVLMNKLKIKVN